MTPASSPRSSAGLGRADIAIVQFPGSNCDSDCIDAFKRCFGIKVKTVWHTETTLPKVDAVIFPGGFSFGDYLRSGVLAAHSPVVAAVKDFVVRGGAVLGICNGFQVLTETGLLPGALLRNQSRRFLCQTVGLKVEDGTSSYHQIKKTSQSAETAKPVLNIPIAHGEGRYYVDNDGLRRLQNEGQIVFTYCDENGLEANPNGSVASVAGICSPSGRVMGLMPHPERATEALTGSLDGRLVLEAFLASFS